MIRYLAMRFSSNHASTTLRNSSWVSLFLFSQFHSSTYVLSPNKTMLDASLISYDCDILYNSWFRCKKLKIVSIPCTLEQGPTNVVLVFNKFLLSQEHHRHLTLTLVLNPNSSLYFPFSTGPSISSIYRTKKKTTNEVVFQMVLKHTIPIHTLFQLLSTIPF